MVIGFHSTEAGIASRQYRKSEPGTVFAHSVAFASVIVGKPTFLQNAANADRPDNAG
jgi:hypothetical protein